MSFRDGGRGRGRGGGFQNYGPPAEVLGAFDVIYLTCTRWLTGTELGTFVHATEGEMVCESTNVKIPFFNAPIYLENKSQVGKVDEILGPINQVYFTIKPQEGIQATSFKAGDKFYVGGDKLLPLEKFLPKPKPPPGKEKSSSTDSPGSDTKTLSLSYINKLAEARTSVRLQREEDPSAPRLKKKADSVSTSPAPFALSSVYTPSKLSSDSSLLIMSKRTTTASSAVDINASNASNASDDSPSQLLQARYLAQDTGHFSLIKCVP
ncbi:hypothetical protein DV738_g1809, partial [Chaetothyriales sp. CBS 135597]